MQNGTLRNTALSFAQGAQLVFGVGYLDNVTVNGDLDVGRMQNGGHLVAVNGLTVNGTVHLGNPTNQWQGVLSFSGTQTLGGDATVIFGSNACNRLVLNNGNTGLTIGPTVTIVGHAGAIGNSCAGPGNTTITNLGTIRAGQAGGRFHLSGQLVVNLGTIEALNGASLELVNLLDAAGLRMAGGGGLILRGQWANTGELAVNDGLLNLQGNWTNTGSINFTNTTLELGGNVRLADLGTLNRSGGTVNLWGIVDAEGMPLELNRVTGSWVMQGGGGTLRNTTLSFADGAQLEFGSGILDNVTVNGDLDVGRTVNGASLQVLNGLTLNGTLYLGNPTDLAGNGQFCRHTTAGRQRNGDSREQSM
jgi:hypothetical protein